MRTINLRLDIVYRCARRTLRHTFALFAFFAAKILIQKQISREQREMRKSVLVQLVGLHKERCRRDFSRE